MNIPKLTHVNCKNPDCELCFDESIYLGDYMGKQIRSNWPRDYLCDYRKWLDERGIEAETEYGWPTQKAFDIDNINRFIKENLS